MAKESKREGKERKMPEECLIIPEGVTVTVGTDGIVTAKGRQGETKRNLHYANVAVVVEGNQVILRASRDTKREKKIIGTFNAHLKNMFNGAMNGHSYTLKICSGHFPMSAAVSGDTLVVKNFFGEKVPRTLKIKPGVQVKVNGAELTVNSANKEAAGQCALAIEHLLRRTKFDRRVFQDGAYITRKA